MAMTAKDERAYERYIQKCYRCGVDPVGYVEWMKQKETKESNAPNNRRTT